MDLVFASLFLGAVGRAISGMMPNGVAQRPQMIRQAWLVSGLSVVVWVLLLLSGSLDVTAGDWLAGLLAGGIFGITAFPTFFLCVVLCHLVWQVWIRPLLLFIAATFKFAWRVVTFPFRAVGSTVKGNQAARRQVVLDESRKQTLASSAAESRQKMLERMSCQLLYDRYSRELADILPRARADQYLSTYMSAERPLKDIQDAARMFSRMVKDAIESTREKRTQSITLQDIAERFEQQREQVRQYAKDPETRDSLLASLELQERAAVRDLMSV